MSTQNVTPTPGITRSENIETTIETILWIANPDYCGGGRGGLPDGGGGGVNFAGGVEILGLTPLFAGWSLLILPETGTRWPFAYIH